MLSVRSRIMVLIIFLLGGHFSVGLAQNANIIPKQNSPYSRFGLGDALPQYYGAQAGMAGMMATYNSHSRSNFINPASLGWLQFTALEVGLNVKSSTLDDGEATENVWSGNLRNISLAFPLRNSINQVVDRRLAKFNWGMALVLQPYTEVGYNLELATEVTPGDGQEVDRYLNSLKGAGGTYQLAFSNGFRYENVAFGVKLGYLFGNIINSRRVFLDEINSTASFATEFLDETSVSGLLWSAGVQYRLPIEINAKTDEVTKSVHFGVYGNSKSSIDTKTDQFYSRDNLGLSLASDTLAFSENIENTGQLPAQVGFGVMYEEVRRLRIGVDVALTNWSNFEMEANPASFENTFRAALGGEYIPENESYNNYFAKVRYRAGVFYGTDPRTVNGEQLSEFGLTIGFGLPLIRPRQQTSYIDMAFELGQFGLEETLKETYFQTTIGFTLNDNTWFFKRKFN